MSREITATSGPGRCGSPPPSGANGLRIALAVVTTPLVHSADQSGSPPVTGTVPSMV